MPFKPGQSGNPGGRPKGWAEVNALARQHTAAAIEALVKSLGDRRTRVQAAQALLDRGWGKPGGDLFMREGAKFKDVKRAGLIGRLWWRAGRRWPGASLMI